MPMKGGTWAGAGGAIDLRTMPGTKVDPFFGHFVGTIQDSGGDTGNRYFSLGEMAIERIQIIPRDDPFIFHLFP